VESWWPQVRKGDLVGYLTEDEHARLLGVMEACTARAGELIFQKGSPSRDLLLIEEGDALVFDESMGEPVVLAVVGPGGVVGEVGFVDGRPRTHHVRARVDCRMRRLTREGLLQLLVRGDTLLFAKLTIAMAQLIAHRFRSAVDELEPVRAFAASLGEPVDLADASVTYDEIDEPLPGLEPAEPDPAQAVRLIKDVARRARKKPGTTGV